MVKFLKVMIKKFRSFYLFVSTLVITLLHLPFAFAKSATATMFFNPPPGDSVTNSSTEIPSSASLLKSVYDSLHLNVKGLTQQAFDYAKEGFQKVVGEKRLFIIDMRNYKVLFNTLVAHGRNTGREIATSFSNQNSTYKSSPGFYITGETYQGKNGYSLKLEGLERGINDNAFERGIVIHGADYVSDAFVNMQGYIGRSQGCPAIPVALSRPIINTIKNGSCLFIYHSSYIDRSAILN